MSAHQQPGPVVVGVDGSAGALAALRFALQEGLSRGVTVQVVTSWLLGPPMRDTLMDQAYAEESAAARRIQDQAIAAVSQDLTELPPITQLVVHDLGGATLIDAAREASMLVVGSGRKTFLARAFLGSVSEFCVRHASVPVVVVPDPSRLEVPSTRELAVAVPDGG